MDIGFMHKLTPFVQIIDNLTERFLGFLVQVGNRDSCSENSVIGMPSGQVCSSFGGEVLGEAVMSVYIACEDIVKQLTSSSTVVTPW